MRLNLNKFVCAESGAVTVDWVVLTAAIVGIAIAVLTVVSGGLNSASNEINGQLNSAGTSIAGLISGGSVGGSTPAAYVIGNQGAYDAMYVGINRPAQAGITSTALVRYSQAYNSYVSNPNTVALDKLAGAEQALVDNGIGIPAGNQTAVAIQNGSNA